MTHWDTLVGADALAARLGAGDVVVLDCRFDLARPGWGEEAWRAGHVPGACYAHLDRDLSSQSTPRSGRHPLPDPDALAARLGAWGIDAGTQVVACDQGSGMFAARAWWLLRWLGHERVAVLDGGLPAWTAAGGELVATAPQPVPRRFVARLRPGLAVDAAGVEGGLADGSIRLVDARGADRFEGRNETLDPVAGHVPGAVNHPFAANLGADGRLLPPAVLRERWLGTLGGREPRELVAMCGSGVSACVGLLALEHAGLHGARLYPGSWSEWIRDPARPVATGP